MEKTPSYAKELLHLLKMRTALHLLKMRTALGEWFAQSESAAALCNKDPVSNLESTTTSSFSLGSYFILTLSFIASKFLTT